MKTHPLAKIQDPQEIDLICKLHAEGTSAREIGRILSKQTGNKYYHRNILAVINNPSNQQLIQKHRDLYLSNPMAVAISHKRVRLEDLNRERLRIIHIIEAICGENDYVPDKKINKYISLVKRLIEIVTAARDEIEKRPETLVMLQNTISPYSDLSNDELREEIKRIDERLMIIRKSELEKHSKEENIDEDEKQE